jgi:inner membrane protein
MDSFLNGPMFWHWWVLGACLMVIEVVVPSTFFLWMGVAAGVVGLVVLLAPGIGWQFQILLFALLAIADVVAWKIYLKRRPTRTDDPSLNRRGQQYVGQVVVLDEAIVNGRGAAKVADSRWLVRGPDAPAGSRVRIVAVEGTAFKVELSAG